MKKTFSILLLSVASFAVSAESGVALEHADVDVFDQLSVIRGAEYYANYCQGCHSLRQIRYSRIGKDLQLNEAALRETILLGDAKIHETVGTALPAKAALGAFGVVPPDLSLVTRSRGADWVYSYLKGFYVDEKRPFGVNNVILPNVAMPNVLWELQGTQEPVIEIEHGKPEITGLRSSGHGKLNPREFDAVVTDLVNYLAYVSEPSALQRLPLGKYVIVFLLFLTFIFHRLKKEYWKDID